MDGWIPDIHFNPPSHILYNTVLHSRLFIQYHVTFRISWMIGWFNACVCTVVITVSNCGGGAQGYYSLHVLVCNCRYRICCLNHVWFGVCGEVARGLCDKLVIEY